MLFANSLAKIGCRQRLIRDVEAGRAEQGPQSGVVRTGEGKTAVMLPIALFPTDRPPTILAGAGLSLPPPTCLPGWLELNDAVLQALGDAVERATGESGLCDEFRAAVIERRKTTSFLTPDLQAQLLEDEIGGEYFKALAHVDSLRVNAAHELIAELARQRRIGAVVTTNFDCAIERAFDAARIRYRCYSTPKQFESLSTDSADFAIVKVHGSSTKPMSMVDTLRQRLHGRPEALSRWMHARFVHYPTIAVGFSADDLQYNPNYLSIRPAAIEGASFTFLVYGEPSEPLRQLCDDLPERVRLLRGALPGWLFEVAQDARIAHALPSPVSYSNDEVTAFRSEARLKLRNGLRDWASSLTRMQAIVATTSLLASAGQRSAADRLLQRTWTHFREDTDKKRPGYARYLFRHGEMLMRGARFRNPHDREKNIFAWKQAADLEPLQFFARAVEMNGSAAALARRVLCEFFAGRPIAALVAPLDPLFERLGKAGTESDSLSLALIDASFPLAELLELCALGQAARPILESAYRSAVRAGDEFRRAEAARRLARNLALGLEQDLSQAERVAALTAECSGIAKRLDIREADAGAALARAIAAQMRKNWAAAAREVATAEAIYAALDDLLGLLFARRERVRVLIGGGIDGEPVDGAEFDTLSLWLQQFANDNAPGLRPLVKYELALVSQHFDVALALDLATDAVEAADAQGHRLIRDRAYELREALKRERQEDT